MPDFPSSKQSPQWLPLILAGIYTLLLFYLLSIQALPFPLNEMDFRAVRNAWGIAGERVSDSWVAGPLDSHLAELFPQNLYFLMQISRRIAIALAGSGLVIWAWRTLGAIQGLWMALLVVGFLPFRLCGISFASQGFGLALFVWGCALVFSPPWSKTAGVENSFGGFLLGASTFATPWSWLYALAIPLRAFHSKSFRSRLQRGFWWGFLIGVLPGLYWLTHEEQHDLVDVGFHLETLVSGKMLTVFYLIRDGWGVPIVALALVGFRAAISKKPSQLSWWKDLSWPLPVTFILGYGDPLSLSLGSPAILFLVVFGLHRIGRMFVNRSEQIVLPTLLVCLLVYHMFFAGLKGVRAWQAYARENQGLVNLIREQVPPSALMALFTKTGLAFLIEPEQPLWYTSGLLPTGKFNKEWDILKDDLTVWIENRGAIWMAPRQFREVFAPYGEEILAKICAEFSCHEIQGQDHAVLLKVNLQDPR